MSLRALVFEYLDTGVDQLKKLYKKFPDANQKTLKTYLTDYRNSHLKAIDQSILINIDTVKEAEIAVQQGDYKKVDALHKIHQMKLKPIVNKEEISLKEMLDQS